MVNKAVVGVIGIVLITTLGVGALVGLQGGGGPAEDGTPSDDGNGNGDTAATATSTPTETTGNGTDTTSNATATDDAGGELALTGSEFTVAELERNLTREINEWRATDDLEPLGTGPGTTKDDLDAMAREHSARMADAEVVAHEVGNDTTETRYRAHGLDSTCTFTGPDGNSVFLPGNHDDRRQFEWIAGHEVETTFSQDRGILFHENESAVATTIVDEWRGDDAVPYGLLSSNYGKAGIDVNVTSQGAVYATVHLCGK